MTQTTKEGHTDVTITYKARSTPGTSGHPQSSSVTPTPQQARVMLREPGHGTQQKGLSSEAPTKALAPVPLLKITVVLRWDDCKGHLTSLSHL